MGAALGWVGRGEEEGGEGELEGLVEAVEELLQVCRSREVGFVGTVSIHSNIHIFLHIPTYIHYTGHRPRQCGAPSVGPRVLRRFVLCAVQHHRTTGTQWW